MLRKILLIIGIIFFSYYLFLNYYKSEKQTVLKISTYNIEKPIEGRGFVKTNVLTNELTEFYYYIPLSVAKNKNKTFPLMIIVGGYNSNGQDNLSKPFRDFADKEGFVILSPSFISNDLEFLFERSYHYPSTGSGNTLLQMIDKLKENNFKFSKLYLFGRSAGAQFCLRFSLWKPDLCLASATHANGGKVIIPTKHNSIKYFVAVGNKDELYRRENVLEFYTIAKKLGINIHYKEYPIGHALSDEQIKDSLDFFKRRI